MIKIIFSNRYFADCFLNFLIDYNEDAYNQTNDNKIICINKTDASKVAYLIEKCFGENLTNIVSSIINEKDG